MRQALVVFALTCVAGVVCLYLLYRYAISYPERPIDASGREVKVVIPRGANFTEVVRLLKEGGAIRSPAAFRIYANYRGAAAKVRAGTFRLKTSITPRRLLETLVNGVPAPQVTLTIAEGKNMLEVAEMLAAAQIADKRALLERMRDPLFLRRVGVPSRRSIDGFLFPDTYKFRAHSRADQVLSALFARHKRVYYQLCAKYPKGLKRLRKELGWGHLEIVTMASIVEKETGRKHERPLIAGVFLNRLTFGYFQPKLLQTDPTIIYGCTVPVHKSPACQRFAGRIRRIHLEDQENPYNTYTQRRLPPGPIANPGEAAIAAVLHPKKSRYLFFVSKNDGTHYFSRTRAQHEHAVNYYQRKRGTPPPAQ